jgi:ammonium transporter, Amt family
MCFRRIILVCAALVGLTVNAKLLTAQEPKSHTAAIEQAQPTINAASPAANWVLLAGCLVLLMPAGFALVSGGMGRSKNSAHIFAINLMIVPLAGTAVFLYGFALGWGNLAGGAAPPGWTANFGEDLSVLNHGIGIGTESGPAGASAYGLLGTKGFALSGLNNSVTLSFFFFMAVCMVIAASIPTGAMAERWAWRNFILYGFWVVVPLSIFAGWVWGGGWLAQMGKNWNLGHGAVDFAGSGVLHAIGGIIGLTGTVCMGPRLGKFVNRRPRAIPGHNIPYVVVGTVILLFGWLGLVGGSALAGTDLQIGSIVVNTVLGAFGGALGAMFYLLATVKRPDPTMMCNGFVAGLVAVSAGCAFVEPWAALFIGAVAGILVIISVFFWDKMGVDDPVGSISMHGVAGLWGVVAVGLFATGKFGAAWNGVVRDQFAKTGVDGVRGLFYGDGGQLVAQLIEAAVLIVFGFVTAYVLFVVSQLITPLRVNREAEFHGLDGTEMGTLAYPDFAMKSSTLDA